jgi:hypothetical protein
LVLQDIEKSMVAKSFCEKYVPKLFKAISIDHRPRHCNSADDVMAFSQFLYCIQSPYLLGLDCTGLMHSAHQQRLEDHIFSLIDGIDDCNPLKDAFFVDLSLDVDAARYLYSAV